MTIATDTSVTVELDPELANAVVEAIAFKLACEEAPALEALPVGRTARTSAEAWRVKHQCDRICRLAAINTALGWKPDRRTHDYDRTPNPPVRLTATEGELRDAATVVHDHADALEPGEDDETIERCMRASRVIAAAIGELLAAPECADAA